LWAAVFCAAFLVIGSDASAQGRVDLAQIHIRVAAGPTTSQALPTVTMMTAREGEPPAPPAVGTTTDGLGTFAGLMPGMYRVSLAGVTRELQLNPREVVVIDGASLNVLDRSLLGEGLHLTERWFTDLASAHDVWALVETVAPYVIVDRMDNGGLATGRSGLAGSRGSSWTTTRLTFGGANLIEPNRHGLMPFAADLSTITSVSVMSGLAGAEHRTPGVIVALTPRSPARVRSGMIGASLTTQGMVAENQHFAPPIQRTDDWYHGEAIVEGPVARETGLLVSASHARIRFVELDALSWTSTSTQVNARATRRASDNAQLGVMTSLQRVSAPFEDRRQFRNRQVNEDGTFWQAIVTRDQMLSGGFLEVLASAQGGAFSPDVTSPEGGTLDRVIDSFVPAPAADVRTRQWELASAWHAPVRSALGGHHAFTVGAQLRRVSRVSTRLTSVSVNEHVGGLPARLWVPTAAEPESKTAVFEGGLYLADRMSLGANLTVNAGVRLDLSQGSARGGATPVSWQTVAPRVSAQWHRGPVALFGGAGWYSDPLSLDHLRHGDPGETTFNVFRSRDGVLVARSGRGPDVAAIDPDLAAPRTFEYTGGLEVRMGGHLTFRSAAIWRKSRHLVASVNTGVPSSSYNQLRIADPGEDWSGPSDDGTILVYDRRPETFGRDQFLLTNPADATGTYEGIETTWTLRTRPVEMLFGATMYRTRTWAAYRGFGPIENDQSVVGEVFETPNARPLLQGSNFFDRSYVGKLAGTVHLPSAFRFGFAARYQDGQPFSRIAVVPDLAVGPEMIHAYRTGRTRYTYTLTLDLRLQKTMRIMGREAAVMVDVFNATQHKNEVNEDAATTPLFRLSTAVQPPMTARVGMRFRW
jgi:hypothetical protein